MIVRDQPFPAIAETGRDDSVANLGDRRRSRRQETPLPSGDTGREIAGLRSVVAGLERELAARDAELEAEAEAEAGRAQTASHLKAQALLEEQLARLRISHGRAEAQLWANYATIHRLIEAEKETAAARDAAQREASARAEEIALLRNSTSWRLTEPLRALFERHPRKLRLALSVARLGWWIGRLQFRRAAAWLHAQAELRRDQGLIAGDPMFDAAHYRLFAPHLDKTGLSPARHYLVRGRFLNISPHPLFDGQWYADEYGDVGAGDPLLHYIREGRAAGRQPNALFDPNWYRLQYFDSATAEQDPLLHFMAEGAAKGLNPSPNFKTKFYLAEYPDVVRAGINPLAHYLLYGQREGRQCKGYDVDADAATPVTATPIECRKQPSLHLEAALFVTHSPNGRLKPHVRHYLEALSREGIAITLIVAADRGFTEDGPWLRDLVDGLYVRGNEGWDFAAWAHVLRLNRPLFRAEILYWLNDSLIGPVNQDEFHTLLERVRQNPAGLVGLTANEERGRHLQSYFLAMKRPALTSLAFQKFLFDIQCFADKEDAINGYEIRFSPRLAAAGVTVAAIFEPSGEHNPTIYEWKTLLRQGFAFLKVAAITNDIRHVDKSDWRETLQAHGYDVLLVDQLLAERANPPLDGAAQADWRPARFSPRDPPHVAFIGPFNYANGLGVASRGYLSAMMHTGYAVNALPILRPFHIHRRIAPSLSALEFAGAADVAIVHLNLDSWEALLDPSRIDVIGAASYRIGAVVWESQNLPLSFAEKAGELNAIWVPSRYCAAGFASVGVPVQIVPHAVPVRWSNADPARIAQAKTAIGLRAESRVILYSFDASSYLPRKNPMALLRAFHLSGLAGSGWRLVLKTKHLAAAAEDGVALAVAAERCAGTVLIDSAMGLEAARTLMEAADIYVSPHAAEGFGLTIAEAMAHGKPVIASDYGGSADFLDASCGFPVRCEPWQLDQDMGPYPRGTNWGRIDQDALTEALMNVAALDPAERAAVGARARRRVENLLSPASVARQMRASIDSLLGR
jgi:glycosyltransferase involved in cell wall biosynthesis